jgi:recombination DNA repair RAD52 pathway protein
VANIYQQLTEPFHPEVERTITKSGTSLTYIPVSEVINRMNKVLGVDKWSMTVIKCERDAIDPDFVVAHVRLEYVSGDGANIIRDGIGGQKIKRTKQGAISDALKKAAQTLGVGLYLARTDDAIEIEQVMEATAEVEAAPKAEPTPWDQFVSLSKSLNKEQKEELRASWSAFSGGKPTPTKETAKAEEIEFLTVEATRIMFGGIIVENEPK